MTGGVITGGWSYVIAAYGISATVFLVYSISIFLRLRSAKRIDSSDR